MLLNVFQVLESECFSIISEDRFVLTVTGTYFCWDKSEFASLLNHHSSQQINEIKLWFTKLWISRALRMIALTSFIIEIKRKWIQRLFFIVRIYTAKSRPSTPNRQRCLSYAISSSMISLSLGFSMTFMVFLFSSYRAVSTGESSLANGYLPFHTISIAFFEFWPIF